MHFDELLTLLGEFGLYQKRIFFLVCVFTLVSSWHDLNLVLIATIPKFRCKFSEFNLTEAELGNASCIERMDYIVYDNSSCFQYNLTLLTSDCQLNDRQNINVNAHVLSNRSMRYLPCQNGYEFSISEYGETIVSEFQLVCDNAFWIRTCKSIFFTGRLMGSLIFGQLSDRFGRKPVFLAGCLLLISGTIVSLSPNLYFFLPMYFCQGMANMGAFIVGYTLASEIVGPKYRVSVGFAIYSISSCGYIAMALMGYFIRHWRYLVLGITLPVVMFVQSWWFFSESLPWLLSHGKKTEAEKVLIQSAKENGVDIETDILRRQRDQPNETSKKHYYVIDCVRTWTMAKISLIIWFHWLIISMVYYGLSLNTENLAGNIYLNFGISGAVDVPAFVFSMLILTRTGRRIPLMLFIFLAGVACILSQCIPTNTEIVKTILVMVGKFAITSSYGIVYLMAAELFPTVIRNTGLGVASMCSGIGAILASIILDFQTDSKQIPVIIFAILSVITSSLTLLLPETAGKPLPQTMDDVNIKSS